MEKIINKIKKMEFSKIFAATTMIIYTIVVFVMIGLTAFINKDNLGTQFIGILGIITPIPLAIIGFYYSKAKAENILKLGNSNNP